MPQVLNQIQAAYPQLGHVWADEGYTGSGKAWIETELSWTVEIIRHLLPARGEWRPIGDLDDLPTLRFAWVRLPPTPKRFRGVLPRRWVAERTFRWLGQSRRLVKEYERLCATSKAYIYAVMSRIMLRRLARA